MKILRAKLANSAHFLSSPSLCHVSIMVLFYPVCSFVLCAFMCFFLLFGVLFYYCYIEMLCTGCGSRRCQSKSNIAEQNLQNFTMYMPLCEFCAWRPILRKIFSVCKESQNSDIPIYKHIADNHLALLVGWLSNFAFKKSYSSERWLKPRTTGGTGSLKWQCSVNCYIF